jgi:hypothetical protein
MTEKILTSFGGKLAEQWVATLLTPAFVFWFGGFAVVVQRWGWQSLVTQFTGYPQPLQITVLVGLLCIIAASAFVVQRLDYAILRFLEGYWVSGLDFFREYRINSYRRYKKEIDKEQQWRRAIEDEKNTRLQVLNVAIEDRGADNLAPGEQEECRQLRKQLLTTIQQDTLIRLGQKLREIPSDDVDVMPTRLGNLLRVAERRPLRKYGLDAVICWPRLWMLLPDGVKKDLQEARADLNNSARLWLWSLLFCGWMILGWSVWASWTIVLGTVSFCYAYGWAINAARTYGELIEASFDLYRHLLYQSIRWNLPPDPDVEIRVGKDLTSYLRR